MKKTFNNIALTATVLLALSACSSTKKISDYKSNDIVSMTTEEEIKNFLFSLLDKLDSDATYLSSGGFTVFVNDEQHRIECDFGGDFMKKAGIKLVSDEKGSTICDFINVLCADFPILDRDYLLQRYSHLI